MSLDSASKAAAPARPSLLLALPWIAFVAFLVLSPMLWLGQASGHDFQFHVASWVDVASQWHTGIFYPRWAFWANYGFGEPRFIFYPPASWMLGAALGTLLPWNLVPGALIWISLTTAGISMFLLARRWLPAGSAVAASLFYAANPYHLVIIYFRSAFAELMASALFPLFLLLLLQDSYPVRRRIAALAAVFAAIWLCDAPAGVIAAYSGATLILYFAISSKSLRASLQGAVSLAGGFALAAFYILPAAFERSWVRIANALENGLMPQQNFLFSHSNGADFLQFNRIVSDLAVVVIFLCMLAGVLVYRRNLLPRAAWKALGLLAILATLLMTPITIYAWRHLPELQFVQFPWRWLAPLNVVCWLFFAAAVSGARRAGWVWAAFALLFAASAGSMIQHAWWDTQDLNIIVHDVAIQRGYEGVDEYEPLGCDHTELNWRTPRAELLDFGGAISSVQVEKWEPENRVIRVSSAQGGLLAIKLVDYPAWQADIDGRSVEIRPRRGSAQALVPVSAGRVVVQLKFIRTPDRKAGGIISILAALLLAGLALPGSRVGHAQSEKILPATAP